MLHDPETYPDPFRFDPERHIATPGKDAQRDPRNVCFGYGRRICPGMYLGEASLFACIATSLAVFNIEKAVVNGVPIVPVHESTSGIIRSLLSLCDMHERLFDHILPATQNHFNASSNLDLREQPP
jgi:cytochrome P450